VKYRIAKVRAYLLEIWDSADVLNDVTLGAIKQIVASENYSELQNPKIEDDVVDTKHSSKPQFQQFIQLLG
jgi:hypothetical protein